MNRRVPRIEELREFKYFYFRHRLTFNSSTIHLVAMESDRVGLCGRKTLDYEYVYEVVEKDDLLSGHGGHICLSCRQAWSRHLETRARIAEKDRQIARGHLPYKT